MAAKKPAKAKKPAARKAEPKKPLPAKAKHVAAKAHPKPKAVPAPKPKAAAAKPVAVKAAAAKAAPAKVAPPKPVVAKAPAAKPVVKPAVKPVVAVPAKPVVAAKKPAGPAAQPTGPIVTTHQRPRPPGLAGLPPGTRRGAGDEEDVGESLSLLAGPRNVKPYLAKKGEQYMGKAQLEHFRTILLSWKRDLMEEVDRTVTHMKDEAANPPDPNDRATLESEFSLELRTRDRERKLIRKIDEAVARIEDGSYGYCLETGEEIGIKRLEARPVATLSIEAQERRERREKQYGDRDDRYR
jgi:DnaK suppressor protein